MGKFYIGIIDGNVSIPKKINREYDDLDEAFITLSNFIHSYDGVMRAEGRVMDSYGDDIEYCLSIV